MNSTTIPVDLEKFDDLQNYLDRKYTKSDFEAVYSWGKLVQTNIKYCGEKIIIVKKGNNRELILNKGINKGLRRKLINLIGETECQP